MDPSMNSDIPDILKTFLEYPFSLPSPGKDPDKEKLCLGDNVDLGSEMGPSAALTPAIWDKTIPYDGETFHLEYMDLEEFLMENGISTVDEDSSKSKQGGGAPRKEVKIIGPGLEGQAKPTVPLLPIIKLDAGEEEEEVITVSVDQFAATADITTEVDTEAGRDTPEPIDPENIAVEINYEPDPTDLVLSSVPGGELFNPRKHKFSDEDLKPQPMVKKAKKVFVPEEQKDEKYWQRRKKNNIAAKRSRDARRLKENQITVRAAFLERENTALRTEVAELRRDCSRYKNVVSTYESKFGPL